MMTKGSYTGAGKVWSGDIEPVSTDLLQALGAFTALTRWTGGGEIEFVEEIIPTSPSGVGRWAIDFNPRFPAWIFASSYAGCNLPALLLQHAQQALTDPKAVWSHPSLGGDPAGEHAAAAANRASFVRTLVETPIVHIEHCRYLPGTAVTAQYRVAATSGKLAAGIPLHPNVKFPVLPQACVDSLGPKKASQKAKTQLAGASRQVQYVAEDLQRLIHAVVSRLAANPAMIEHSPRYVLNIDSVDTLLKRNKGILETAIAGTNAKLAAAGAFAQDGGSRGPLQLQMCLSVKTQPNTDVVRAAYNNGYLAECIDMAEVYHSVEDSGFPFERVVLTGPGKWWDRLSPAQRAAQFQYEGPRKLHAVFADSLADLRTIAARLLDPTDVLDAEVIGIRWAPIWGTESRFGLDPEDTEVVRDAAALIAGLPEGRFRLGMHFHHASSVLGGKRWFALASAFAVFCGQFSTLCGQPIATIDIGGGFEPHFLSSEFAARQLPRLFENVHKHCNTLPARSVGTSAAAPVCVQFELGKSVSEDAGGVLTRILAIRERRDRKQKSRRISDALERKRKDEQSGEGAGARAIVVDTTCADISTPNAKAVFLVRLPSETDAANGALPQCVPLAPGNTLIWGRTCMEWDGVRGAFELPADVREGDMLLIAGCGAYDMSMQYDFGDGIGRTKNVVML
jgi:diaminopimelate decarboxylase